MVRRSRARRSSGPKRDVVWSWNSVGGNTPAASLSVSGLVVASNGFMDPTQSNQSQTPADATLIRTISNYAATTNISPSVQDIAYAGIIAWPVMDNIGPINDFPLPQDGSWDWILRYTFPATNPSGGSDPLFVSYNSLTELYAQSHAMRKMGADLGVILVVQGYDTAALDWQFDFRFAFKLAW